MSQTTNEVINPLNQYTMEKERYILIYMDRFVHRFKWLIQAKRYAESCCRGIGGHYIIVDTQRDDVVDEWYYESPK